MWPLTTRQQHIRETNRYQTDVTDEEWHMIGPYLPTAKSTGRPRAWPWIIVPRFFTRMDSLDKRGERDRAPYRLWCEQGWMEATPGNVIDHARIRETIL